MLSIKTIFDLEREAMSREPSAIVFNIIALKHDVTINDVKCAYIRVNKGDEFLDEIFIEMHKEAAMLFSNGSDDLEKDED